MNRSLGNLLRCLVGDTLSNWDSMLAQAEFAYNNSMNRSTGKRPFEIVNGIQPRGISSTIPLGLTMELLANCNIVGVSHKPMILSFSRTSLVITLIDAPKSMRTF